jgi:hypothetical protein
VICNFSLPHLLLCTVNTVTHSYNTSAVLSVCILFYKYRQKAGSFFQVSTIFFSNFVPKFQVQTSGWTKRFNQVQRQYLILDFY